MEFSLILIIFGLIEIIVVFLKYYYKGNNTYSNNINNNVYIRRNL